MAGKGSNRRPQQVSREEYDRRWQRAFGGGREYLRSGRMARDFADRVRKGADDLVERHGPASFDFLDGYAPTEGE